MLNLIKNEYAKIFHKKSTYFFLILVLFIIIAIPVYTKISNRFSNEFVYYSSVDEELMFAKSENAKDRDEAYIEELELVKELGMSMEDYYDSNNWKSDALSLFYNYRSDMISYENTGESTLIKTDEDKTKYESLCTAIVDSLKNNDWKGYFTIVLNNLSSEEHTEEGLKLLKEGYTELINKNISPQDNMERFSALMTFSQTDNQYKEYQNQEQDVSLADENNSENIESDYLIAKYNIEHNTSSIIYKNPDFNAYDTSSNYIYTGNMFLSLKRSSGVFLFIALFIIIVAGKMISSEFSKGTIKFLLITPVKRYKIFWSKYIVILSLGFIVSIISYLLSVLISIIIFGPGDINTPLLLVENGNLVTHSGLLFVFFNYMLKFIQVIIAATIAFMCSSLFRNSAIAIAAPLLIYLSSTLASQIALGLSLDFFRYTIFANFNVFAIAQNVFLFQGMTRTFSISVIAIHIFLLLFTAHDAFTKKNV